MGSTHSLQLDAVLCQSQETIRFSQVLRVFTTDIAAGDQLFDGVEGVRRVYVWVGLAVNKLQELDGELDVTETPGAKFYFAATFRSSHGVFHIPAHVLHSPDEPGSACRRPNLRFHDTQ